LSSERDAVRVIRRRAYILAALGSLCGLAAASPRAQAAEPPELPDPARLMNELMAGKVPVGGPFSLTDTLGARKSLAEFRGKIVLLYFGYTYCPDVCPTDLSAMSAAIRSLGASGDRVQPIFITVDPERDTPEVLRSYAAAFDPRLIALRGSEAETRSVATAYKAYYERVPIPGRPYLVNHTAFVYLLGRDGKFLAFFPPGTSAERMAATIREVMELEGRGEAIRDK
jgi:protein SCO1/2